MADTAALRELERKLERMETSRRSSPSGPAVPTGVEPLDALLPRGGLPRGEGTEWLGPRSCGKTALLRTALERLRAGGEPVALVDAARTLHAPDWEGVGKGDGLFWVVRPPSEGEAAWCADLLLRSGAFGAVALLLAGEAPEGEAGPGGGARPQGTTLSRGTAVRLQRLAEEAGAVLVVAGGLPVASLRLRFRPGRVEPVGGRLFGPFLPDVRPLWIRVGPSGRDVEVPVLCPRPPRRGGGEAVGRDRKGRR